MHAQIFINYRQDDSSTDADRLYEELKFAFGPDSVFMDFHKIQAGAEWPDELEKALVHCTVVLMIVGKDWLEVRDSDTRERRLDVKQDWVRRELERAIKLKKEIIPVLVRDGEMPTASQLPTSIKALARRQKFTIPQKYWKQTVGDLIKRLENLGIPIVRDHAERIVKPEPSMIGVIDYFFRRIGDVASHGATHQNTKGHVDCRGMSDLWHFVTDLGLRKQSIQTAHPVRICGQLSPYGPLLFGHPRQKRQLHLELRQGAAQLVKHLGQDFGDLLNGLLSYSAGQMVIRPYFRESKYIYMGLYESIVRNCIPVMIEREYFDSTLGSLFRQFNSLDVTIHGFLGEMPNYVKAALDDFGISRRLKPVLHPKTIETLGQPSIALFVEGVEERSFVAVSNTADCVSSAKRYLDGDVWIANGLNSLITRFIDISSREEMKDAAHEMRVEVLKSRLGRGTISSFDTQLAPIDETLPDRILSGEQMAEAAEHANDARPGNGERP